MVHIVRKPEGCGLRRAEAVEDQGSSRTLLRNHIGFSKIYGFWCGIGEFRFSAGKTATQALTARKSVPKDGERMQMRNGDFFNRDLRAHGGLWPDGGDEFPIRGFVQPERLSNRDERFINLRSGRRQATCYTCCLACGFRQSCCCLESSATTPTLKGRCQRGSLRRPSVLASTLFPVAVIAV